MRYPISFSFYTQMGFHPIFFSVTYVFIMPIFMCFVVVFIRPFAQIEKQNNADISSVETRFTHNLLYFPRIKIT